MTDDSYVETDETIVCIDKREKKIKEMEDYLDRENIPHKRATLLVCDYQADNIYTEKKGIEDYCTSLIDGTLFDQAYRQSYALKQSFTAVVGSYMMALSDGTIALKRESFVGSLQSIALKRADGGKKGIVIPLVLESELDFRTFIKQTYSRALREREENDGRVRVRKPIIPKFGKDQLRLVSLAAVKGVGLKRAKLLFEEFESLDAVIAAWPKDLAKIKSIGKVIARSIHEHFYGKVGSEVSGMENIILERDELDYLR